MFLVVMPSFQREPSLKHSKHLTAALRGPTLPLTQLLMHAYLQPWLCVPLHRCFYLETILTLCHAVDIQTAISLCNRQQVTSTGTMITILCPLQRLTLLSKYAPTVFLKVPRIDIENRHFQ